MALPTIDVADFLLIVVGIFTGFINTVAGGGSIITLPVLILYFGLPPVLANGTNRVGILVQTLASAWGFHQQKVSPFVFGVKKSLFLGVAISLGALIGARFAIQIPEGIFNKILSVAMLVVLFFTFYKPKTTRIKQLSIQKAYLLTALAFFLIGIYAGFIQAGTGLLLIITLSVLQNLSLLQANALKTIIVFMFTIGTVSVFAYHGQINFWYGILLAIGNALGGLLASRISVKKGDGFIRFFMAVSVFLMAFKLWFL